MSRSWRRSPYIAAVLSLLVLSGCESADPADVEPIESRSFDAFEASVLSSAQAAGIDVTAPAPEAPRMMSSGDRDFVFVQGTVGDVAVEAMIGSAGGVLNLGSHWLLVPKNAVRGSTLFRMTPISDGTFHVDLTATGARSRTENDVGQAGFRNPVYLAFHYGDPSQVDASSLMIAWLTNGALVTQQTFIYEQEWAVGVLRHFSGYVLVAN